MQAALRAGRPAAESIGLTAGALVQPGRQIDIGQRISVMAAVANAPAV